MNIEDAVGVNNGESDVVIEIVSIEELHPGIEERYQTMVDAYEKKQEND